MHTTKIIQTQEHDKPIHILVIGKTRVGKSAVINAIAGKKIAREGQNTKDISREVARYDFIIGDVKYVVWEAPGLQDTSEDDSAVIAKLKNVLKRQHSQINLVIYCTLMNRERFEQSEVDAIHNLTKAFTSAFWGKTVFALTYANRVLSPEECETDEEASSWFTSRVAEFGAIIKQALLKSGVSSEKITEIAVVPTGYHRSSFWEPNAKVFYGITDWFLPFWGLCEKKIKDTQVNIVNNGNDLGKAFK